MASLRYAERVSHAYSGIHDWHGQVIEPLCHLKMMPKRRNGPVGPALKAGIFAAFRVIRDTLADTDCRFRFLRTALGSRAIGVCL